MKKRLQFFCTITLAICAPCFINAAEPLAEETLHGTITVTVKWYDNTPWTGGRGNFQIGESLFLGEAIHEIDFNDPNFIPAQIERWQEEDRPGNPPTTVTYDKNKTILIMKFPWIKNRNNTYIQEFKHKFGWEGAVSLRNPTGAAAQLANGFVDSHNALDPDFKYRIEAFSITSFDDFELNYNGYNRESNDYISYTVLYRIYKQNKNTSE